MTRKEFEEAPRFEATSVRKSSYQYSKARKGPSADVQPSAWRDWTFELPDGRKVWVKQMVADGTTEASVEGLPEFVEGPTDVPLTTKGNTKQIQQDVLEAYNRGDFEFDYIQDIRRAAARIRRIRKRAADARTAEGTKEYLLQESILKSQEKLRKLYERALSENKPIPLEVLADLRRGMVVHCKREPYDVYIGRGSSFGNPYKIGVHGTREEVIAKYEKFVRRNPHLLARIRRELRGKVLGCWCAPKPCHGNVLLQIANEKEKE